MATRDVHEQSLRPVTTTGHAGHIGALSDRLLGQLHQIVALTAHNRPHTRRCASVTRPNRATFPPPDHGFISSTPAAQAPPRRRRPSRSPARS